MAEYSDVADIGIPTDFSLCIICQNPDSVPLVATPHLESFDKVISYVNQHSHFNNGHFRAIHHRLQKYTSASELQRNGASWHLGCYRDTVNPMKLARAEKAFNKKVESDNQVNETPVNTVMEEEMEFQSPVKPFTRSSCPPAKKDTCFFCGEGDEKTALHEVCSFNVGRQIREAVQRSGNREWQVKLQPLNPDDARAIDIKYHRYCYVKHVKRSTCQIMEFLSDSDELHEVSAETELITILKSTLVEGKFLSMDYVRDMYIKLLKSHGLNCNMYTTQVKEIILKHMHDEVEFSRPYYNKPERLCSSVSGAAAVRDASKVTNLYDKMQEIMKCALSIRQDVLEADKWTFQGSFSIDSQKKHVPVSLQMFLKWIIQGASNFDTDFSDDNVERATLRLCQNVMFETKSYRQVHYHAKVANRQFRHSGNCENEQMTAVALKVHSYTRSRSLIDYLHNNGYCISYSRLIHLEAELAKRVLGNQSLRNILYVPPTLLKGCHVFFAIDNIDFNEDTIDGKKTLHGTAMVAFQIANTSHSIIPYVNDESSSELEQLNEADISQSSFLRQLKGSVIPPTGPLFNNFTHQRFDDVGSEYYSTDRVWLLNRFMGRTSDSVMCQLCPSWGGYNSVVLHDTMERPLTKVHVVPLVTSPANEYNTMVDILKHARHITLTTGVNKSVVTFDMDLYIRAVKLQSLHPDAYSNFIFRVGEFHTVLCTLRALGSYIENSGIDEAWIHCDLYGATTTRQILEGKHMRRGLDAHLTTVQALFDLIFELFLADKPDEHMQLTSIYGNATTEANDRNFQHIKKTHSALADYWNSNLSSLFDTFTSEHAAKSSMFSFLWSYIEQVHVLLQFIRASRQGLWLLHLSSLEKLCSLFFCQDRLKYAQYIPLYLAQMHELPTTNPDIYTEFLQGNFCVNKSNIPFSSIGVDHAIEHVNRSMKVLGGIRGLTQKPDTLERFFVIAPELARLSSEASALVGYHHHGRNKHHDLSPSSVRQHNKRVETLKAFLREENPLIIDGPSMVNFVTKCIIPDDVAHDLLSALSIGKEKYMQFTAERIVGGENIFGKMTRLKLKNWTSAAKQVTIDLPKKNSIELKENRSLFARLALAVAARPDLDMAESIGKYEFSCVCRALFASDGSMLLPTNKSQLADILKSIPVQSQADYVFPCNDSCAAIIDGMVIVQQLSSSSAVTTCSDLADQYISIIKRMTVNYGVIHVVFDNYTIKHSLKQNTRNKRTKGAQSAEYICADNTRVVGSLKAFLANVNTKHSLTLYLAKKLLQYFVDSLKKFVVSTSEGALCNRGDVSCLSSNHEEADTMLILHAAYAFQHGNIIHIFSPDTDVFVLAIRRFHHIGPQACVVTGVGNKKEVVPLQPIIEALGSDMVAALPGFHAFTGCDTTSRFSGKGKQTCWKTLLKSRRSIVQAFARLGTVTTVCEEDHHIFEDFVCHIYQQTTKEVQLSRLRWNIFRQNQAEAEKLPPTSAALRQHVLRVHYQCMIWWNDTTPVVDLPSPTSYGWEIVDSIMVPTITNLKPAPEAIIELIKCKCSAGHCRGRCSCFMANMVCTQMCKCDANPESCDNVDPISESKNSDDSDDDNDNILEFTFDYYTDYTDCAGDIIEEEVDNTIHLPSTMDIS